MTFDKILSVAFIVLVVAEMNRQNVDAVRVLVKRLSILEVMGGGGKMMEISVESMVFRAVVSVSTTFNPKFSYFEFKLWIKIIPPPLTHV